MSYPAVIVCIPDIPHLASAIVLWSHGIVHCTSDASPVPFESAPERPLFCTPVGVRGFSSEVVLVSASVRAVRLRSGPWAVARNLRFLAPRTGQPNSSLCDRLNLKHLGRPCHGIQSSNFVHPPRVFGTRHQVLLDHSHASREPCHPAVSEQSRWHGCFPLTWLALTRYNGALRTGKCALSWEGRLLFRRAAIVARAW